MVMVLSAISIDKQIKIYNEDGELYACTYGKVSN